MSAVLPQNWTIARLDECTDVLDSQRVPINNTERQTRIEGKPDHELYPYFGATGEVGKIDDYLFDEELVALGEDGVPFLDPLKSKAYMLKGKTWVNNHAHVLRAINGATTNAFLLFFLNQFDYHGYVNGGTRLKLTQENMRRIPIPLPPLAEQKQIAAKLDELLAQVDPLKARLDAIPAILKRFRQSVLAAAVSGRLTGEEKLFQSSGKKLAQLVTTLDQGWSPKCINDSAPEEKWAVIKTTAIQSMVFHPSENKELPDGLEPRPNLSVKKGDVLITRAGPRVRCGVTCVATKDHPQLMICDKVYRARFDSEKVDSNFVNIVLNSPGHLDKIEKLKTGSSDSGMNLTQEKFLNIEIPAPGPKEQTEIVRRVEQLFAFADQIEQRVRDAQARVNHLTQSILAKAFRGELTADWRAQNVDLISGNNSAEALLARIRAARANDTGRKKRGRGTTP